MWGAYLLLSITLHILKLQLGALISRSVCLVYPFSVCIQKLQNLTKNGGGKHNTVAVGGLGTLPHQTPPCSDFTCGGLKDGWVIKKKITYAFLIKSNVAVQTKDRF